MVEVERLSRFRQRGDGGLQISGLLPDDTGMFQCFARNGAGEVQTSTYLAVTSKLALPCPCVPPAQDAAFLQASSLLRKDAAFCRERICQKTVPGQPGWLSPAFTAPVWCSGTLSQGRLRWLFERSSCETPGPALSSNLSLASRAGLKPPRPSVPAERLNSQREPELEPQSPLRTFCPLGVSFGGYNSSPALLMELHELEMLREWSHHRQPGSGHVQSDAGLPVSAAKGGTYGHGPP